MLFPFHAQYDAGCRTQSGTADNAEAAAGQRNASRDILQADGPVSLGGVLFHFAAREAAAVIRNLDAAAFRCKLCHNADAAARTAAAHAVHNGIFHNRLQCEFRQFTGRTAAVAVHLERNAFAEPQLLQGNVVAQQRKLAVECYHAVVMVERVAEEVQYERYVELWTHEVKIPLSLFTLLLENRSEEMSPTVYKKWSMSDCRCSPM